jgi:hypothetical protein
MKQETGAGGVVKALVYVFLLQRSCAVCFFLSARLLRNVLQRYDKTPLGGRANVGFPNPPMNAKQNLLGSVKGESTYKLTFQSATGSRGQNKLR